MAARIEQIKEEIFLAQVQATADRWRDRPSVIHNNNPARPEDPAQASAQTKFETDLEAVFDEAYALLLRKHHDYGPTNIGRSPGGALNGIRVRIWDKQARINNLLDKGAEPANESLRDSFLDLMNYAAIALVVMDGKWPE